MFKRILLIGLGLVLTMGTAFAGPATLTESDMEQVSAQGLQVVINDGDVYDQNNNNGSVQLNDAAQLEAAGMAIVNEAASAVNIGQNVASVDSILALPTIIRQTNDQYASNYVNWDIQDVVNYTWGWWWWGGVVDGQNNNNDSVQLNDAAQLEAAGMVIANTAASAANVGQNVASATSLAGLQGIGQSNYQTAINDVWASQFVGNYGWGWWWGYTEVYGQDNNNASVQVNDIAQYDASGMAIANTAASAVNIGQNVASAYSLFGFNLIFQDNYQTAINSVWASQYIDNGWGYWWGWTDTFGQDNNNNSVQLNNHAQQEANGMLITNIAGSASNVGQNVASAGEVLGFNWIEQYNSQYALNFAGSDQYISNWGDSFGQDNNNASVQLNNHAQEDTGAMAIANAAASATNIGQNVAEAGNLLGLNVIIQGNSQIAANFAGSEQIIDNYGWLSSYSQDNNNASVQVNNHGQKYAGAMSISNAAASATNIGQNVASAGNLLGANLISQYNYQSAYNFVESGQGVYNDYADNQDNNNASVQLNNEAQEYAGAMLISNAAASALNVGQNVASAGNIALGSLISQSNYQGALNEAGSGQVVYNWYATSQDNNNASVQLNNEAQEDTGAMAIVNMASSAGNVGQNVASTFNIIGLSEIYQANYQWAENYDYAYQTVSNGYAPNQDNNNNSVQLNDDAQMFAGAMAIINSASSAFNVGQNVASATAGITGVIIAQLNYQDAYNVTGADQYVYNGYTTDQDNNNGSVQLNDDAQYMAGGMVIGNIASSASNVGQNVATVSGGISTSVTQTNIQGAVNIKY